MTDEQNEAEAHWRMILEFYDQSPSFAHGYEAGKIGYRMQHTAEQHIVETVMAENEEVLRRMGAAFGWSVAFDPSLAEGWLIVQLKMLPARQHLAIVK